MSALPRVGLHRATFVAAGLYNLAWGVVAAVDPDWLFRFAGLEEQRHPQIFASLGMVIGVYGLGYLEVARRPADGFALAALGLLGKVLGPIGMAWLLATGQWPPRMGVMCLTNDLIWWLPFGLYLVDAWPAYRGTWVRAVPTAPPGRDSDNRSIHSSDAAASSRNTPS